MKRVFYTILWFLRKVKRKLTGTPIQIKQYAGKELISKESAGDMLSDWIIREVPFMAARFGASELQAMVKYERKGLGARKERQKALDQLSVCSGFFPNKIDYLSKFCTSMYDSCKSLDLLAVWSNYMEDYVVERYCPDCVFTSLQSLEPWYTDKPWTAALKGKKVLVIHPFVKTIRKQYPQREKLFPGTEILPEFGELYTLKAVQTIAGQPDSRFDDWFEALDWMYREAMKFDFDIAIIGCGAYGFPLASRMKESGRQAVHMGGATQILFGIKGKRWDNHPVIGKLYNEYWVRPDETEKPHGAENVEEGCYW